MKLSYFFVGLLIGLLIGAGSVWLFSGEKEDVTAVEKALAKTPSHAEDLSEEKSIEPTSIPESIDKATSMTPKPQKAELIEKVPSDTLMLLATNDTLTGGIDSLLIAASDSLMPQDSSTADTTYVNQLLPVTSDTVLDNGEEIIVKKDILLQKHLIELSVKEDVANVSNQKDSALLALSGIQEQAGRRTTWSVEFWQSPIHYKGYKMANNKVVVFGLQGAAETPELFLLEEQFYLFHSGAYFKVENTFDFKALKVVVDDRILEQLRP